ncbi:MAG: hypothetical protein WA208_07200, partial [Thermoanaerobaculia bacterium]
AWPEQTFGPAGALCAQPDTTWRTNFAPGVCIGGRRLDVSDDPSSLAAAEHVAGVRVTDDVQHLDFAFSYNVVTTVADAATDEAPVQGSLRQFIENANAIRGANVMRFVPLARPTQEDPGVMQARTPRWWLLRAERPFPPITDDETVVDGNAYSFLSPISATDLNPGKVGLRPAVAPYIETPAPRQERPELEIVVTGEEGLACSARCVIRMIAIHGARVGIVTRADARIEHVMVGTRADAVTADARGDVGVQIEGGSTVAEHLLVEAQTIAGIAVVTREARLDAKFLDVGYCGKPPASGAAIALFSDGSSVSYSVLHQNEGAAVVIGDPAATTAATRNTLVANAMSRNGAGVILSPGASWNTIWRNTLMWNLGGAVVAVKNQATTQRGNRITENTFNENGFQPIILSLPAEPRPLAQQAGGCEGDPSATNGGLRAPRITSVRHGIEPAGEFFLVRGSGCPGRTIELYRSYVSTDVRRASESRLNRRKGEADVETLMIVDSSIRAVPSVGEFNFVGSTTALEDGSFEAKVPFATLQERRRSRDPDQFEIWADEALGTQDPRDSAFSALTIDAEGNTSELSARHAPLNRPKSGWRSPRAPW